MWYVILSVLGAVVTSHLSYNFKKNQKFFQKLSFQILLNELYWYIFMRVAAGRYKQ